METGKRVDMFPLQESERLRPRRRRLRRVHPRTRLRESPCICNPNNPDGGYLFRQEVLRFIDATLRPRPPGHRRVVRRLRRRRDASPSSSRTPRSGPTSSCSRASARTSACTASGSATSSPTRVARGEGPHDAAQVEPQLASPRPWCSCSTVTCRPVPGQPAPGCAMDRLRHGAASCPQVPGLTRLSRRRATSCFVKLEGQARGHRAARAPAHRAPRVRPRVRNKLGMTSQFLRLVVRPDHDMVLLLRRPARLPGLRYDIRRGIRTVHRPRPVDYRPSATPRLSASAARARRLLKPSARRAASVSRQLRRNDSTRRRIDARDRSAVTLTRSARSWRRRGNDHRARRRSSVTPWSPGPRLSRGRKDHPRGASR